MTRIPISPTRPHRFAAAPRLATAAVFAAAVALGVNGLGDPAVAAAKPIDWHAYDSCVGSGQANDYNTRVELCCLQVGGFLVIDRQTKNFECMDHDPTGDECKWVISTHCARQLPGVRGVPPGIGEETLTPAPPPPDGAVSPPPMNAG